MKGEELDKKEAKRIPALRESTVKDGALIVLKALLGIIPGGSVLAERIVLVREERTTKFIEHLAEEMDALKEKIDEKYLTSEEFIYVFEKAVRIATMNYRQEKIEMTGKILLNSLITRDRKQEEIEYFLSLVERLSPIQLQILAFFSEPRPIFEEKRIWSNIKEFLGMKESGMMDVGNYLKKFFPEIDEVLLKSAYLDLHTQGLLEDPRPSIVGPRKFEKIHIDVENPSIELVPLAPIANKFIAFCTGYVES